MENAKWRKYTFEPRLGERLQRIYKLPKRPATLAEYIQLGKELVMSNPEGPKYIHACIKDVEVI